jgi:translation elongation factor EF-Ts
MNNYQLSHDKMDKENEIIQEILHRNGYNTSTLKSISSSKRHEHGMEKTHWSKFTYISKETRAITKVLKNTRVKVTYSTNNTLGKLLKKKHYPLKN